MYLEDSVQQKLRSMGKIKNDEIILKEGDLYVVENVVSKERRIVNGDHSLLEAINTNIKESSRQILKG